MADPTGGPAAATAAIAVTTGPMLALGSFLPPGASFAEFIFGCIFSVAGAFSYQFIAAQAARQEAANKGLPVQDRPKIDSVLVGYAMCGAPMAAACLIYAIHKLGGVTGFGQTNWLLSAASFMIAGAAGPPLVFKVVGLFTTMLSKTDAKP